MSVNQSGYLKFLLLFLLLPLIALIFLKPPLTKNPKVDYGACSGSLAANKSFRFNFTTDGLHSADGQKIDPRGNNQNPYGLIQFQNKPSGHQLIGTTDPASLTCDNTNNCRFINLQNDPKNADAPYTEINDKPFRLFRQDNLIPKAMFPWHMGWIGQIALPDEPNKLRNVWIILTDCNGNRNSNATDDRCKPGTDIDGKPISGATNDPKKTPSAAGWGDPTLGNTATQPAFFLLYVQKDTPDIYKNDFVNFDLYYKVGDDGELDLTRDLPKFILDYCKNAEPITPLSIVQTGPESYNPPKTLNLFDSTKGKYDPQFAQIDPTSKSCPTDQNINYKLVLYTKFGGTVTANQAIDSSANPSKIFCGTYQMSGSNPQDPNDDLTYYVKNVSFANFLTLTDKALNYTYYYLPDNTAATTTNPQPTPSTNQNLQLTTFNLDQVLPWGWWTPECKPAIYLYPKHPQTVNVQVTPQGYLTYTDPPYPISTGWTVTAHPNGQIDNHGQFYPYLYYESKIHDQAITKPLSGWVVPYSELGTKLHQILPQLGLNSQESTDFVTYWVKSLPESAYYYIGVLSRSNIDQIEPLNVSPNPDTAIRVRLYFQALTTPIAMPIPVLPPIPARTGFTLVEWGGLVKNDLNHPFTCSQ